MKTAQSPPSNATEFKPSDIPVLPGDIQRIADENDCKYLHVWRWYNGRYKNPVVNEDALLSSLVKIVKERKALHREARSLAES